MKQSTVKRISADLVTQGDRERVERVLQALQDDEQLPEDLVERIVEQARALSAGRELLVVESDRVLSTTEAAALLGCSRPHLVKLCERGEIAFHRVGRDRRILARDVAEYLEQRAADREVFAKAAQESSRRRDERVAAAAGLTLEEARELGL